VYISEESNADHRKSQIFVGDIVVVRTGQAGTAVVVPHEFDGANCIDLLIIRKASSIVSEYLATYVNSWAARTDVEYKSVGAIQAHYNTETLANLIVPLPPVDEQKAILSYLEIELRDLNRLIARAQTENRLLREYCIRLTADVVTGKLDVREAAKTLSDIRGEAEPLDEIQDLAEDQESAEDAEIDAEETV
jgi:type I restriction enzyme S subunit